MGVRVDGNGFHFRSTSLDPARATVVMGILNATPDSFWAGSRVEVLDAALAMAETMLREGAAVLDVGGESTRPGAPPVPPAEQIARVAPLVAGITARFPCVVSVDARHPDVARAAIDAGAEIVNDITGLGDPAMRALVAERGAVAVVMHMQGEPGTMQADPRYVDVVAEVDAFFSERIALCKNAGIETNRLWLDPGIGFGKALAHNLALIRHLDAFAHHGCPLFVGLSRKSFIGRVTGKPVEERLSGTSLYHLAALERGARILRVHDVPAAVEVVKVWESLR